jgi:hypothetical protein
MKMTTNTWLVLGGAAVVGYLLLKPSDAKATPSTPVAAPGSWDVPSGAILNTIAQALGGGSVPVGRQVNLSLRNQPVTVIVDEAHPWVGNSGAHGWNYIGRVITTSTSLVPGTVVTWQDQNIVALL